MPRQPRQAENLPAGIGSPLVRLPGNQMPGSCTPWGTDMMVLQGKTLPEKLGVNQPDAKAFHQQVIQMKDSWSPVSLQW